MGIKSAEEGRGKGSGPASLRGWYLSKNVKQEFDLRLSGEKQAPQREARRWEVGCCWVEEDQGGEWVQTHQARGRMGSRRREVTGTSHDSSWNEEPLQGLEQRHETGFYRISLAALPRTDHRRLRKGRGSPAAMVIQAREDNGLNQG